MMVNYAFEMASAFPTSSGGIHTKRVPLRQHHCVGIIDAIDIGGVHTVNSPENVGEQR